MFNKLGGLAFLSGFPFPFLFQPLLQSMYQGSSLLLYPLSFLLLAWAAFPRYGNVCFTFPVPCWAIPLGHWQCLFIFPALCDSIVHDVYIYDYVCVGDCALCMMDSRGYCWKIWFCISNKTHYGSNKHGSISFMINNMHYVIFKI